MAALDPPDAIRVYFNSDRAPDRMRFPGIAVPIPGPRFWTLRTLAAEMRSNPPDLLFVPSHVIPPIHPTSVVTIHDLGYLVEPECHEPVHRKQLAWATRWNCHAASGIVAVSESTRDDLIERLGVPPEKIRVIRHGVSPAFRPATADEIERVRQAHRLPMRLHPRGGHDPSAQESGALDPGIRTDCSGRPGPRAGHLRQCRLAGRRDARPGAPQPLCESNPSRWIRVRTTICQRSIPRRP